VVTAKDIPMPIITANQTGGSFSSVGEQITIAPPAVVSEESNLINAFTEYFDTDVLDNFGAILSIFTDGVEINFGSSQTLINEAGGVISGHTGVYVDSPSVFLINYGSITSTAQGTGVFVDASGSGSIFDNRGYIRGDMTGVEANSAHDVTIVNSGTIESNGDAFSIAAHNGAVIHLLNSGMLKGASHAIVDASGALDLQNTGTMVGSILLFHNTGINAFDNDHLVNQGSIVGTVSLGFGDDFFSNAGGGVSGAIFGQEGNDQIVGGAGADVMSGGPGDDTLTGGPGADQFVFDTPLGQANIDRITDFAHKIDKIVLSHAIFTATNASGALKSAMFAATGKEAGHTRILYHPGNGFLYYDQDGSAHGHAPVHFSKLAAHLALTSTDFLVVA
jgi:Ca2+-binding RTX toxin-like protein